MNQALKKSCRSQLTKLVNRANEILAEEVFDVSEAIVLISRLKSANESLNKINSEVAKEIPMDQVDVECEKIIEYEDKAVAAISGLEFKVSRDSRVGAINVRGEATSMEYSAGAAEERLQPVSKTNVAKRAVRLPKLELIKFNGDYHLWPAFWEQFNSAIHSNDELDDSAKFTYLKSVLTGNASITVQGLTSSCSSYKNAIDLLKEQYGNNEKIINSYIQQLLTLNPVKNKIDVVSLRKLYNTTSKITRSLQTLGMSPENYGIMVKSIVLKALPFSMRTEFHKRQVTSDYDDNESVAAGDAVNSVKKISYERQISQLLSFIKLEVDSIEQAKVLDGETKNYEKNYQKKTDHQYTAAGLFTSVKEQCLFCQASDHDTINCTSNISLDQKKEILRSKRRCYRCTKPNHNSKFCRVKISCLKCKGKHAISICDPNYKRQNQSTSTADVTTAEQPSTNLLASGNLGIVYLQTACAQIMNTCEMPAGIIRMVLDGGSQLTFIKECLSRQLNLPIIGTHKLAIMGFGQTQKIPARLCKRVSITLKSNYNDELIRINAIEVPEICFDSLSAPSLEDPAIYKFSRNFPLADSYVPNVKIIPGISLLIGTDSYWKIVSSNTRRINDSLMGIETKFGWTIHGAGREYSNEYAFLVSVNVANILYDQCDASGNELDLRKFWTLEAIGINSNIVTEKLQTNKFISDNITFQNSRYCVSLPWLDSNVQLDSNFHGAFYRLKSLTRKLNDSGKLQQYDSVIREYMNHDCAELSPEVTNESRTYFMPHRAVYRDDKDTTKVRVVFDASAHAPGLPSLNDVLLQGENLVPHLSQILMNFRIGKIALIADIEKAFLQIEIAERDRDSHSFLWYETSINDSSNLPKIKKYRMKRVTFGVTCSPFLLAATLKKHLQAQSDDFKGTSDVLVSSFYVDDLILAVDNIKEDEQIYLESKEILAKANMNLRKWASNDIKLRNMMNCDLDDKSKMDKKKVLGVWWYLNDDDLSVDLDSVLDAIHNTPITKRRVLQAVSKIFDPLGFLSPFVIKAKLDWDSLLQDNLTNDWLKWCSQLSSLNGYSLPRCVLENENYEVSLHIFADASLVAFGAVAYLRVVNENNEIKCRLLMAKNRIAPIDNHEENSLILPRLEPTGAVCAVRLQHFILTNIHIEIKSCVLWTDFKITLHWIRGKATRWKPHICNRVAEIQKLSVGTWRHCSGTENPADLFTRMVKTVQDALKLTIWKKLLSYDELQTVLYKVEASVNSRPLTYIDDDSENLFILSPSHFLLGSNECGFSIDSNHPEIKRSDILKKWKERNRLTKIFWKKWSCDYLQQLRTFHKQDSVRSKSFKVGDVALLNDQNLPRLSWKLVRISRVFHGRDCRIRACEVITSGKTVLCRPIQLLYSLEITAAGEDVENLDKQTEGTCHGQP